LIFVFDSGVWISAFQFGGTPLIALRYAYMHYRLAACDSIIYEIHKTMARKFDWTSFRIQGAIEDYLDNTDVIGITGKLHGICRDPKDDMVIECAVLSGAKFIVSGDKDLIAVKDYEGIQVLTPRQFLQLLGTK
jgi:putative PIN family toxin of toxin-antitoxin system